MTVHAVDDADAEPLQFKAQATMVIAAAFTGAACVELLAIGQHDAALAACDGSEQVLDLYLRLADELEARVRAGARLMQVVEALVQDGWPGRIGAALGPGLH